MSNYGTTNNDQVEVLRNKVDDVKGVMKTNINKLADRGDKLAEMEERAHELNHSATLFEKNANKLKQKMWWQNFKLWVILLIIIGVIIAVIVAIIVIVVIVEK